MTKGAHALRLKIRVRRHPGIHSKAWLVGGMPREFFRKPFAGCLDTDDGQVFFRGEGVAQGLSL